MGCTGSKDKQKAVYDRLSQYQLGKIQIGTKIENEGTKMAKVSSCQKRYAWLIFMIDFLSWASQKCPIWSAISSVSVCTYIFFVFFFVCLFLTSFISFLPPAFFFFFFFFLSIFSSIFYFRWKIVSIMFWLGYPWIFDWGERHWEVRRDLKKPRVYFEDIHVADKRQKRPL